MMMNKIDSQNLRLSNDFNRSNDFNKSISNPKSCIHLPSIHELFSEQNFPKILAIDTFVCKNVQNDLHFDQNEMIYKNNAQIKDNFEMQQSQMIMKEKQIFHPIIEKKLPSVRLEKNNYNYYQTNSDNQVFSYHQAQYNPNKLQVLNNRNFDPRYYVQYQVPLNSMPIQISENRNPLFFNNFNYEFVEDISQIILDPVELRFIPVEQWSKGIVSLENLKKDFFCARSSKCLRFEYKLWNALQITKRYPFLFKEIGVKWVSKSFIMVHRDIFGHLLQVTRPSAALFSSCGMFMTHGFREIMLSEVRNAIDPLEIPSIDESIVRLFTHKTNDFNEDSGTADIVKIKWNNESRKKVEK